MRSLTWDELILAPSVSSFVGGWTKSDRYDRYVTVRFALAYDFGMHSELAEPFRSAPVLPDSVPSGEAGCPRARHFAELCGHCVARMAHVYVCVSVCVCMCGAGRSVSGVAACELSCLDGNTDFKGWSRPAGSAVCRRALAERRGAEV